MLEVDDVGGGGGGVSFSSIIIIINSSYCVFYGWKSDRDRERVREEEFIYNCVSCGCCF